MKVSSNGCPEWLLVPVRCQEPLGRRGDLGQILLHSGSHLALETLRITRSSDLAKGPRPKSKSIQMEGESCDKGDH